MKLLTVFFNKTLNKIKFCEQHQIGISFYYIFFQKVFKKDDNYQSFELAQKICSKMENFFITYENIKNSIDHLKIKSLEPQKISRLILLSMQFHQ